MACGKDKLLATVKAKVEPTPELIELLKRYRGGLNMAIKWAVEEARAKGHGPTLSEMHKALYEPLKAMGLPSVIAQECYREALAVVKSYIAKGARGKTPVVRKLHMRLRRDAYSVKDGYLHVTGGHRTRIVGMEERYKEGEWREARLVYRGGNLSLYISVEIPRPMPITPRGVITVNINKRYVYYGNSQWMKKVETPVERLCGCGDRRNVSPRSALRRTARRGVRERSSKPEYAISR